MMKKWFLWGLLALVYLTAAPYAPVRAAVDNAVCSVSDQVGCTGTNLKTNTTEEIAALSARTPLKLTSVSGTNDITACTSPAISTYTDRQTFSILFTTENTTVMTLSLCSVGVKSLKAFDGSTLPAFSIKTTVVYTVMYFSTNDEFRIISPLTRSIYRNSTRYFNELLAPPNSEMFETNSTGDTVVGTGSTNRPGVVQSTTAAGATASAAVTTGLTAVRLSGGETVFEAEVNVTTLSTSGERFQLVVGLLDTANAANQVDAVAFVYDEGGVSTGSSASANWQAVTSSNSTRTWNSTASGSSAVTAGQWDTLRIVVNAAGNQALFYVNDVLRYTHTTNIPIAAGRETGFGWLLIKSVGTTARTVNFDYVLFDQDFTTTR